MCTWSCNQSVCASCRYWTGRREIDFTGTFYDALESSGKCCNPNGGFRSVNMSEGASCGDYACFK